jgi:hypothetical protein
MNVTMRHLVALDRALAKGITITLEGKSYCFTPANFDDLAEHLAYRKSLGVAAYLQGAQRVPQDNTTRVRDLAGLTSRTAKEDDYSLADPINLIHLAWLSLRHSHPDTTLQDVSRLLENDQNRDAVADLLGIMDVEPEVFDKPDRGDGDAASNPT